MDSHSRCWRVIEVRNLGAIGGFWERLIRSFFRCPIYRVSCELSEAGTLPLDQLKERVCASIDADPERWWDDEAIAGEDGPPRDAQEMLDELKAEVRRARSVGEIIQALWPPPVQAAPQSPPVGSGSSMSIRETAQSLEDRGVLTRQRDDQSELVIDRVRELLGRELPQDLMDFYRERIARVGDFGTIAPSWNDYVGWRKDDFPLTALLHAEAVPIFSDGCFNLFGLDLSSGAETPAVYFFEESRGFERPIYAAGSSLGAFLLLLAEEDLAFRENRPPGWQLAIDPGLDKCPRAPPIWRL